MRYPLLSITMLSNLIFISSVYAQHRPPPPPPPGGNPDSQLQNIVKQLNLTPINQQQLNLPTINDKKAQLGKQLFFAKNLGGEQSAACVSCHHPVLGGGDNLSLSVGVKAVNNLDQQSHDLLGIGRFNGDDDNNLPTVARNAPSVFNIALLTRGLFWDSRVERTPNGQIVTPDSSVDQNGRRRPDGNLPPNTTLAAAQARFPVTAANEMRGEFLTESENQALRASLAARFNSEDNTWLSEFNQVFNEVDVTFDRIAEAIGEYERSMLFVNNPWQQYLQGNNNALTEQQKAGAVLFFTPRQQGGANCVACHNGPTFSDQRAHLTAYPQIGEGAGNQSNTGTSQDFGRENVTGNSADRYHFRTPSLLNVALTAPYGHSGAFQTLTEVVAHYVDPVRSIDRLFAARGNVPFSNGLAPFCRLPQMVSIQEKNNIACEDIFPDAYQNSKEVVNYLMQARTGQVSARAPLRRNTRLSPTQVNEIVAFLNALTDPCANDRSCLAPWIIDGNDVATYPDDLPLVAHDKDDTEL